MYASCIPTSVCGMNDSNHNFFLEGKNEMLFTVLENGLWKLVVNNYQYLFFNPK